MSGVFIGIMLVAIGLLFCFRGYVAMRFVIPLWGAMAGFLFGAGLVASVTGDSFLATLLGWTVGLGVAMLFGLLAYLYFEVSVFIAMAAIGFVLGTSLMTALGTNWNWLIILVGVTVGALLAMFAILYNMPAVLLTVLTATAGASVIITGVLLTLQQIDLEDFEVGTTTQTVIADWWWYTIYIVLVIAGVIAQIKAADRLHASIREAWAEQGGREMRSSVH